MTLDILTGLALFAFVSSITPGPNNLMLMASGANFGFRRTIPHMLGISIGFAVMMVLVGAGLTELFDRYEVTYTILKVLAVAYMLYLALKIARAAPSKASVVKARPMTFMQAAAFQWVNPKAWAMALTAITVYVAEFPMLTIALCALFFAAINLPSVTIWTVLGQQMARILNNPARLRAFNWTMAALLVASLWPVLQMGPPQ